MEYTDELSHHGILGMKWGVRRFQNADGSLTDAGKKRYLSNRQIRKVQDLFDKSSYKEDISDKVFAITKADKSALQEARKELALNLKEQKEITAEQKKLFDEIESDKGKRTYYEAVSEIASYGAWKNVDDMDIDDIGHAAFMGIFEDGQQSTINAYSMYAYKNNIVDDTVKLGRRAVETQEKCRNNAKRIIQDSLDQVGGQNLAAYKRNPNASAAGELVQHMLSSDKFGDWKSTSGLWYLDEASFAANFTEKDKSSIRSAEKIAKNLRNNTDGNTWYLLNEAAENLGMSYMKASEMTQSDWDRINAEIARIR